MDELEAAVALVYAQPPADFVAARTALVKQLKADKRKDEAAAVAALRRPTKLAWALGQAARQAPEPAAAYFDAIAALGQPGVDLRRRTADLRDAVAALARAAEGVEAGEANAALMATAADPDATTALRLGRLADVPAAGGFGLGALSPRPPEAADAPARPAGDLEAPAPAEPPAEQRAEQEGPEAAEQERQEQAERERAEHRAAVAAELAEAKVAESAAADRVAAAQAAVEVARLELASATTALEQARRATEEAAERLRVAGQS